MRDIYQERYTAYQEFKKNMDAIEEKTFYGDSEVAPFFDIMYSRRSQRLFNRKDINEEDLITIVNAANTAPSSCNRNAVSLKIVRDKDEIEKLSNLLVGGRGWMKNSNIVILFLANMLGYKSPNEVDFMLYLDTGFIAQNIYLASEAISVGSCFVNPNIREDDKEEFYSLFAPENHILCGAIALGNYDMREQRRQHEHPIIYGL